MEILFFIVCVFLIGSLMSGNTTDRPDIEDIRPPRRSSRRRRPIVIDYDDDDDEDEEYYYRKWRAGHRERTRMGALQHTLLFVTALVIGMIVYDGCGNKNISAKRPENVKYQRY